MIEASSYRTLRVRIEDDLCVIQLHRPDDNNTINDTLIEEFTHALQRCENSIKIVVVEGSAEVFCLGADFKTIATGAAGRRAPQDPTALYDLWLKLAQGPFITIAHVRGKANAGGIGFIAACDIVLSDEGAVYSLSEMLFGLIPACVLPFLNRRIGAGKASYLTLTTQTISAQQAYEWGLVDALDSNTDRLLRKQLLRLRRLSKASIVTFKNYTNSLGNALGEARARAIDANLKVFTNETNLNNIARYVSSGRFPWDA